MKEKFQIFGSRSSRDYDVLVFVDQFGTTEENHQTVKRYNEELALTFRSVGMPEKKVNANLGILTSVGTLGRVFKGTPDEVNNSLRDTYHVHDQLHDQHIKHLYDRTQTFYKHVKLKRCYRFILSFYSRTELRNEIKVALKGDFKQRHDVLSKIDFNVHTEFPGKKDAKEDIYKTIAFQLAQTIDLVEHDIEHYTKESIARKHHTLLPYIMRMGQPLRFVSLNSYLQRLLQIGTREMSTMADLKEETF